MKNLLLAVLAVAVLATSADAATRKPIITPVVQRPRVGRVVTLEPGPPVDDGGGMEPRTYRRMLPRLWDGGWDLDLLWWLRR